MDPFIILLVLSILIGIVIIIFLSLTLKSSTNSSEPEPSVITIDCNDDPTPRNLTFPSSFPFNLQTNGLGGGSVSLIYYSVPNPNPSIDTPLGIAIYEPQDGPAEINPSAGTQGIQYVFTCNKVPVPLTVNTPSPVSINPYIPYQFFNGNIVQNMNIALTDINGDPSTLGPITAGSSAVPNPPAGYNSYSASFI